MLQPLVSIIIPAWNAVRFLPRALDAALGQRGVSVEVIVVDDGSTDSTRALARNRATSDPRLRVLTHPTSRGPSAARNTALANARGDWVALLDADDSQDLGRLERLVGLAQVRRLDLLADNMRLIEESSGGDLGLAFAHELVSRAADVDLESLLVHDWPGRSAPYLGLGTAKPIIRREFLVRAGLHYEADVRLGEDLLFYSNAVLKGAKFGVTPDALYLYTVRRGSASRRPRPTMELVDVNGRIQRAAAAQGASRDRLELLERRGRALKFQVFTWAVKQGRAGVASRIAQDLGPASCVELAGETVLRRVRAFQRRRRITNGADDLQSSDSISRIAGRGQTRP